MQLLGAVQPSMMIPQQLSHSQVSPGKGVSTEDAANDVAEVGHVVHIGQSAGDQDIPHALHGQPGIDRAVRAGTKSNRATPEQRGISLGAPARPLGGLGQPAVVSSWNSHRFLRLPRLGQCRNTAGPGVHSSCDFLLCQGRLRTFFFLWGMLVPVRVCMPVTASPTGAHPSGRAEQGARAAPRARYWWLSPWPGRAEAASAGRT